MNGRSRRPRCGGAPVRGTGCRDRTTDNGKFPDRPHLDSQRVVLLSWGSTQVRQHALFANEKQEWAYSAENSGALHSFTVQSCRAAARKRPSGEKATELTLSDKPLKQISSCPVTTCQ